MKKQILKLTLIITIVFFNCEKRVTEEKITPQELVNWQTLDKGKTTINGDELIIEETEGSDGFFLISPKLYPKDFTLKYKVKALSESTVLINLFSVLQDGDNKTFKLPDVNATPREVWDWRTTLKHYNLTYNNRSHGNTPFFFKNTAPNSIASREKLDENIFEIEKWYDVEVGKKDNKVWFKLNNKTYFDFEDTTPLEGGRLIFRISGTTGDKVIFAKAAIKNIVISY
ncbi:hypothetical protein [uncultured Psychroserpens sp.]|uniref:hypothetical protein n=1 Tax=uncultured Psychroserpens sp. TaxID=255436 RepID=UPI002602AECD|nr:hypothetical protein [uncultured Psychroserpens sp.]